MSRRLEVLLHGEPVGQISETPVGGADFRLLEPYRKRVPRPVLGQKFEDDLERIYSSRKGQDLPDFFANLIPEEGRLREVIEESGGLEPGDDLALLAHVGQDLPGAVTVRALDEGEGRFTVPSAESESEPNGDSGEHEGLRFSLAGVQLKFSMLRQEEKLTLPARNQGGEWIVKFDSPVFRYLPENEYSMLEWARVSGFEVPECHLQSVDDVAGFPRRLASPGTRVLVLRRYDRDGEGRIHQEDFAQAVGLPPKKKYDQITYEVMGRLTRAFIGENGLDEFVRRLAFAVASGNGDAHLKNWSLIYPDQIRARWSPLYDQVATIAWATPARELALKLAAVKAFGQVDRSAFERFAEKVEVPNRRIAKLVDDTLESARDSWKKLAGKLPLPEAHARALVEHWQKVPLLRPFSPLEE